MPFVVESPVLQPNGDYAGTARVYVATEERAQEIASAHPERTYRSVGFEEMPAQAREAMLKAERS